MSRRFPPPWSGEETDGGLLVTDVDPAAQSRAPYPAGSVASTAAAAATAASYQTSYQQAHAATAATATSATTNCTAAAPAAAYMAAAYMAAAAATAMASAATAMASAASTAAAPSAASPCKPYAGAKFSFFVENVKGPQAHIKHFLLGEENFLPSVQGLHAQAKPPIYVVTEIDVSNLDAYLKEYVPLAQAALKAGGGRILAAGQNITPIEGTPPKSRVTILQWESIEQYNAYRKSAAFADARKIGDKYAKFRAFAIEAMPQ
jgi:uncharacterized protein (DUF1330 family)